jgi:DNA polymerase III subunit delta'
MFSPPRQRIVAADFLFINGLIFEFKNGILYVMSQQYKWPIYGHHKQLKFLQETISQDKLANTYLFYGSKGLGKKTLTNYFVKSIFCLDTNTKPCEKCAHCQKINKGIFLDIHKVGDREDLGVDNIREFMHKISMSNVSGHRKIAIVYGIETINLFGANALLKTLEEPPANTTIILIANSINNLPATVMSRAQLIKFKSINRKDMKDWLKNYDFSDEEKETIINLSFGRPGLALKLMADDMEQFKKSSSFILKMLSNGTFYYMQTIDKWFSILKKEYPAYKVYEIGNMTREYLDLFEVFLRDILWAKLDRPIVNQIYNKEINSLSNKFDKQSLIDNLLSLNKAKEKLNHNISPQLMWENLFLSIK